MDKPKTFADELWARLDTRLSAEPVSIVAEASRLHRERVAGLVMALEKAADTFRDSKLMMTLLGRAAVAQAMSIAEEYTRAALAAYDEEQG